MSIPGIYINSANGGTESKKRQKNRNAHFSTLTGIYVFFVGTNGGTEENRKNISIGTNGGTGVGTNGGTEE
mgnify:CR=1 FL=1